MKFKKGERRAGRQKGTPNKSTVIVRQVVEDALGGKTVPEAMLELAGANPKLRLRVYEAILPYCYPKLQAVEVSGEVGIPEAEQALDEFKDWLKRLDNLP